MILENMSDEEIFRVANPIMDNLMDASTAIDHERHIRDFSERMKIIVTKEYLQKVCEIHHLVGGKMSNDTTPASYTTFLIQSGGTTPANVNRSVMRKSPGVADGNVGVQPG